MSKPPVFLNVAKKAQQKIRTKNIRFLKLGATLKVSENIPEGCFLCCAWTADIASDIALLCMDLRCLEHLVLFVVWPQGNFVGYFQCKGFKLSIQFS